MHSSINNISDSNSNYNQRWYILLCWNNTALLYYLMLVQIEGGLYIPSSKYVTTSVWHFRHLKYASLISGLQQLTRRTWPLILTSCPTLIALRSRKQHSNGEGEFGLHFIRQYTIILSWGDRYGFLSFKIRLHAMPTCP